MIKVNQAQFNFYPNFHLKADGSAAFDLALGLSVDAGVSVTDQIV